MDIRVLNEVNQINELVLDEFVHIHSNGNFFQSSACFLFFKSVDNYEPIIITATEQGKLKGLISALIIKDPGFKGIFSRRCIVWAARFVSKRNLLIRL